MSPDQRGEATGGGPCQRRGRRRVVAMLRSGNPSRLGIVVCHERPVGPTVVGIDAVWPEVTIPAGTPVAVPSAWAVLVTGRGRTASEMVNPPSGCPEVCVGIAHGVWASEEERAVLAPQLAALYRDHP